MSVLFRLLKKELLIEIRSKETVITAIALSILLSVMAAFGTSSSFLSDLEIRKLFPGLLWLVFLFSATIALGRSHEFEQRNGAMEGIILTGVAPSLIFITKVIVNWAVSFISQTIILISLSALLHISLPIQSIILILFISVLTQIGYASLGSLLVGISSASRLKTTFFPLILLPLVFPLFFAAIELTNEVIYHNVIDPSSVWISLLIGVDLLYLLLGINLYEFVIKQ